MHISYFYCATELRPTNFVQSVLLFCTCIFMSEIFEALLILLLLMSLNVLPYNNSSADTEPAAQDIAVTATFVFSPAEKDNCNKQSICVIFDPIIVLLRQK